MSDKQKRKQEFSELLDILNEFPEFFNEGEAGCPAVIVARVKELGSIVWGATKTSDVLEESEYRELCKTLSDTAIAVHYGISKSTLDKWKKRNNIKRGKSDQYAKAKLAGVTV